MNCMLPGASHERGQHSLPYFNGRELCRIMQHSVEEDQLSSLGGRIRSWLGHTSGHAGPESTLAIIPHHADDGSSPPPPPPTPVLQSDLPPMEGEGRDREGTYCN